MKRLPPSISLWNDANCESSIENSRDHQAQHHMPMPLLPPRSYFGDGSFD